MAETLSTLLAAGLAAGSLREDITGQTLMLALSGVCRGPKDVPDWYEDGRRVVGLLADGLRRT